VLLTHGPGIDQPLSAIRMGYGDYHTAGYQPWPTFSVVPLWNQRGQAPFIAFGAGGSASVGMAVPGSRTFCPSAYTDGRCLGTQWLLAWDAYGARKNGTLRNYNGAQVWLGSAMEDQQDASGLLYRRNRYYDPATGRFTQEDPIGLAGGINLYGFANGDPVTYADPYGLEVVFANNAARFAWRDLLRMARRASRSQDQFTRDAGSLLMNMMNSVDASVAVIRIDVSTVAKQSVTRLSGGSVTDLDSGRTSPNVSVTVSIAETSAASVPVALGLAHELGHGWALMNGLPDVVSPAFWSENAFRRTSGCAPRPLVRPIPASGIPIPRCQ
jgi:RHS repeat-associated protein